MVSRGVLDPVCLQHRLGRSVSAPEYRLGLSLSRYTYITLDVSLTHTLSLSRPLFSIPDTPPNPTQLRQASRPDMSMVLVSRSPEQMCERTWTLTHPLVLHSEAYAWKGAWVALFLTSLAVNTPLQIIPAMFGVNPRGYGIDVVGSELGGGRGREARDETRHERRENRDATQD